MQRVKVGFETVEQHMQAAACCVLMQEKNNMSVILLQVKARWSEKAAAQGCSDVGGRVERWIWHGKEQAVAGACAWVKLRSSCMQAVHMQSSVRDSTPPHTASIHGRESSCTSTPARLSACIISSWPDQRSRMF